MKQKQKNKISGIYYGPSSFLAKKISLAILTVWMFNLTALSQDQARQFLIDFTENSTELKNWIHPSEIERCNRLGIIYDDVKHKEYISYLLPPKLHKAKYQFEIDEIDKTYSALHLSFPVKSYKTTIFFRDDLYISPIHFHTRDWEVIESKHFRFYVSEMKLINEYSMQNLENFLTETMPLLQFSEMEQNLLKKEKIDYVLCKNSLEIENLTGFNTRGIYLLAQDCVVSIFNSHYHELAHLLINYKLKRLPIYTNPFLQEGFAVAIGGRGGKEPEIILDMGKFLIDSNFLDYDMLLSRNDFYSVDVSLSYPVCGLYNKFLIEKIGIEKYLQLYRKCSSTFPTSKAIVLADLPIERSWTEFLQNSDFCKVWLEDKPKLEIFLQTDNFQISENDSSYCFLTKRSLLLKVDECENEYQSSIFQEKYPDLKYKGEKYLIQVSAEEVMIYNLFTNNLIADYASGFSTDFNLVTKENDFFVFYVKKEVFEEELTKISFKTVEAKN